MISIEQIYNKIIEDFGGDVAPSTGYTGNTGSAVADIVGDLVGDIQVSDDTDDNDGIKYDNILGSYKPGDGVLSNKNNFIPKRVKTPLKRFEIAGGGSIKKKKTPYEKNMKIITASKNK